MSIAVLAVVVLFLLHPPRPIPAGEGSRQQLQPGPWAVGVEPFELIDKNRPTAANGSFKGLPYRELKGDLWRPLDNSSNNKQASGHPLLVYSHGFMSMHSEGAYLAEFLASHGYVVVAVDFPLTNYFAAGDPTLNDVINQPGDVTAVLNRVLERNTKKGDTLFQQIDLNRIGVIGLSLGGMTTELVSFDPRYRDTRIKAAVSIAGAVRMFNARFFSHAQLPFLMIAADSDAIVNYADNAATVREKDPDSVLVTIHGGSHAGFAGIASVLFRWVNNPDTFGCSSVKSKVERNDSPFAALIDNNAGVIPSERRHYCEDYKNLPRAMRPAEQQMYATLAAYSFFESIFNADIAVRNQQETFLLKTLAAENPAVTVSAGNYRAAMHP